MAADNTTEAAPAPDRSRILVVDDAADAREVIQTQLEDRGFRVAACSSVEEALALLAATPFDLIITDLRMPRASGLELVRHVRDNLADAEVMIITGYPTIEGAVEAVKTGAEPPGQAVHRAGTGVEAWRPSLPSHSPAPAHAAPAADGAHGIIGAWCAHAAGVPLIDRAGARPRPRCSSARAAPAANWSPAPSTTPASAGRCSPATGTAILDDLIESELFATSRGLHRCGPRRGFSRWPGAAPWFPDLYRRRQPGHAGRGCCAPSRRRPSTRWAAPAGRCGWTSALSAPPTRICPSHRPWPVPRGPYYRINVIDILPPLRERGDDLLLLVNHFPRQVRPRPGDGRRRRSVTRPCAG